MSKMSVRTSWLVAAAVLLTVMAISSGLLWLVHRMEEASEDRFGSATPVLVPSPDGGLVEEAAVAVPATEQVGTDGAPTYGPEVPPPPPVSISAQNSQGLRRVEFSPPIGDVFRLDYDPITDTLLLAVVETDGSGSIWRLSNDETVERVLMGGERTNEIFLGSDSRGTVYAGFAGPGTLYRSADRGVTWQQVASGIDGTFWGLTDDGNGTLWGSLHSYNSALLYRSTDDGLTWQVWRDFQRMFPEYAVTYREGDGRFKLRHLHDVAYVDGQLFVGVGDVARFTVKSDDGGLTWRQVWSEGFTAHVQVPGNGLLLGPDRLQSQGLARYDFGTDRTEEVWSPIPFGWAGFTYSLMRFDGVYYAAFHNEANEVDSFSGRSGVVVSRDGFSWYPFMEIDPLTNWARTDIFLAPRRDWTGWITLNGALYIFESPIGRWFDVHRAFGG
ncbi:hypothetical protein COY93_01575 [Candidatus Uhrbacteria bacterium CG_4_10_14_0_8_um_filter_58_22]|uniref:Photosynthesis system II assembly factor Ycf48/Hcf136-like domain-containing protein n=1 Tax=Candidatus Uhrbacteria bacterium CG_4_10_14_0_8_um_filter_58_22 TaxID=1975029 RepID=A0A2M7QAC3_9BACT|nr:MAG: hypothetical protein AUJ19_03295 [Parcubacteria group bacterium CG1_02_58_44]PIY62974.1 MAG: hypothetical protein COY93_01575 [Candidatus Uhrbacteria bacterium CG_4_10_14_0_8_um_filter_58_22]